MEALDIRYDHYGRMFYNPEFHANSGKPWSYEDMQYLIEWYDIIGPEEMSFALERTVKTVMVMVNKLRKKGVMVKPKKQTWNRRIKKELPKQPINKNS